MTSKETALAGLKTYIMVSFALTGALWWANFVAVNMFGARSVNIVLPGFQSTAYASEGTSTRHR